MKRYLNLNEWGGKIIVWAAIFLCGIPGLLSIFSFININQPVIHKWIRLLIGLSVAIGGAILGGLIVFVVIEQIQDAILVSAYDKNLKRKVKISPDFYECQFCGNRQVREFETTCRVCGKEIR